MNDESERKEWILCPKCGNKTRLKLRKDTVLTNFPLFCPKCKEESLIDAEKARQTALDFYGPIFLLYSIYDGAEDKSHVIKLLEEHMDHFLQEMQIS